MTGLRVFVTQELYPFTAGGIGRVIGNVLAESSRDELRNTAIVYLGRDLTEARFKGVYPDVRFLAATEQDYQLYDAQGRDYPAATAYGDAPLRLRSVLAMQALRRLERDEGPLGYVEFTDWGGAAFAACQEKRLGRAFAQATLAVRLHTTDALLSSIEQRFCDQASLALYDLERKALADCDMIVGQLRPVAESVRRFFDFKQEEWTPRLRIHAPPVKLSSAKSVAKAIRPALDTPITFSSKIQHCKRPETFVRGVAEFLLKHPQVSAPVCLLAHAFDEGYLARIKALVPKSLGKRFQFLADVAGEARERMIAGSVCLFPSAYESFCLATYEASLSGAYCIVNSANPAFGEDTPWIPGRTCLTFDGTAEDLVRALEQAYFSAPELDAVVVPADPLPWNEAPAAPRTPAAPPRVSVFVSECSSGAALLSTLDSLNGSSHADLEVIVADNGSGDAVALSLFDRLEQSQSGRISVARCGVAATPGSVLNRAAHLAAGDYILFLRAGDVVSPDFIEMASVALASDESYAVATSVTGCLKASSSYDRGMLHAFESFWLVIGEARAQGLHVNRYSPDGCLMRARLAREVAFNRELEQDVWWDFHFRAVASGARYLVSNTTDIVRSAGADEEPTSVYLLKLRRHDVLRDKKMDVMGVRLPTFVIEGGGAVGSEQTAVLSNADYHELRDYRSSETVFVALKLAHFLESHSPRLLALCKRGARFGLRTMAKLRRRQ